VIEPGRSLVEDFGFLVTRVVVRKTRDGEHLLIVDPGTNLVRSLPSWYHPVDFAEAERLEWGTPYHIYGALCFESDMFTSEITGPEVVDIGTLVIVGEAGGYDIPSANVWIRPSPVIFGLQDGHVAMIRMPQSVEEMQQRECALPAR